MHVHANPAPRAKHKQGAYRPDWVEQGIEEHEFGPLFGCSCGYYALNEPNLDGATGLNVAPYIPIVWADVTALGDAVIHDGGFRCESYKIERLFWPCLDDGLTKTYPGYYMVRDQFGGNLYFYYAQPESLPLEEILPKVAADLDVELIRRPVGLWLQERSGIDGLIRSASEALGGES